MQDQMYQQMYQNGQMPPQQQIPGLMDMPVKTVINTEDIKEIVYRLNQKPFNENYNLVTFDELNPVELLELLNKIFTHLDKSFQNIKERQPEQIIFEVVNFLKILNYPVPVAPQDVAWQQGFLQGDKRVIWPIVYYLLSRLPDLEKRAYLARYLVPFVVSEDVVIDDELRKYMDEYKNLQAEFQVYHQQYEGALKDSKNPIELKKEITQLEQEKEQLVAKINEFKKKNTNRPEFQALLEQTNLLRREQEEEAKLIDKLRQQKAQQEWTDQQLLASQQRLVDSKKSLSNDNTPEQMLMSLRNEVKKNRELCQDRLAIEINEKRKKLEQIEKLLSEPPITQNELINMETLVINYKRAIAQMEEKLSKQTNPQDDKLAIYKQQAALVTKKKEKAIQELKKAETDMGSLEKQTKAKEEKLQKSKGVGFQSQDDFKNYATQLRDKTKKFKQLKEESKELQDELALLTRTEQIIKQKFQNYEQQLKQIEQKHGIVGFFQAKKQIEAKSEEKQEIDQQKGKTLEQISQFINQIEAQLKEKKAVLQPKVQKLKEIRAEFEKIEVDYKAKKAEYDKVMLGSEQEIAGLDAEVKSLRDEVYKVDSKINIYQYESQIYDLKLQRLNEEQEYQKGSKQLSKDFKTYQAMFESKCAKLDEEIKTLRVQREQVKNNYEPALRQQNMFADLKKLLQLKLKVQKTGNSQNQRMNQNRNNEQQGNVNRLVIDN